MLLITQTLSQNAYQKMKKGHGFDDDICAYTYSSITYVKPCEEGKFCENYGALSKCEEIETSITPKYYGERCDSDFECDGNLICRGTCQINCLTTEEVYKTIDGNYNCRILAQKNILYEADKSSVIDYNSMRTYNQRSKLNHYLSYFQVAGKISLTPYTDTSANNRGTLYSLDKVESAYIGSVDDGEFVMDPLACKSGYALYFYPSRTLVDPSLDPSIPNKMYLMCVTLLDLDKKNYMIKYNYNGENIYNPNQINAGTYSISTSGYLQPHSINFNTNNYNEVLIQKEIFGKYIGAFTIEKQAECETKKIYNNIDQRTCEDNEARKWWYFYNNAEEYVLYYDEEDKDNDITNYLLQTYYRTFISGSFLNAKFLISIIILLFL